MDNLVLIVGCYIIIRLCQILSGPKDLLITLMCGITIFVTSAVIYQPLIQIFKRFFVSQ